MFNIFFLWTGTVHLKNLKILSIYETSLREERDKVTLVLL